MSRLQMFLTVACFVLVLVGCQIKNRSAVTGMFSDVSVETNTQLAHIGDAPMMPLGAGVAFGDYNNDGWLDIFLCGSPLDKGDGMPNALFHNQQDRTFTDVSSASGINICLVSKLGLDTQLRAETQFRHEGRKEISTITRDRQCIVYLFAPIPFF